MLFERRLDWKLLATTVPVGMAGTWVLDSMRLLFQQFKMMPEMPPMMGRRMLNLRRSQTQMGANVEEEPKHPLEVVTGYQAHYVNGVILAALYALAVPRKRLSVKSGVVYSLVFPEAAMMLVMLPAMGMGPAGSKGMGVARVLPSTALSHVVWGAALGAMTEKAAKLTRRL
jgi:hypothetical protein